MSQIPIRINKGSGAVLPGVWPSGEGPDAPGANLTGWGIEIYDAHPDLAAALSVAWTDAAAGTFALSIAPITTLAVAGTQRTFRLRITPPSGDPKTTPAIALEVR